MTTEPVVKTTIKLGATDRLVMGMVAGLDVTRLRQEIDVRYASWEDTVAIITKQRAALLAAQRWITAQPAESCAIEDQIVEALAITAAKAPIAAAHDALVEACKASEWGATVDMEEGGTEPGCPWCDQAQRLGHSEDCGIAKALALAAGGGA
jgi:hypothetical protein